MALVTYDRVRETGIANTTVSFTLTGAVPSCQDFTIIGNGNTTYYGATDGTNWEVGLGTYSTTGPTLTRTLILSSSNAGSAVTFSGTVNVFVTYPASQSVYQTGSPTFTSVTTPSVTATTTDLTLNAISTGAVKFSTLGGLQGQFNNTASTVNYFDMFGSATTKAIQFKSNGSDTNISMAFQPKGTGAIDLAAGSSGVNISNGNTVTAVSRGVAGTYTVAPIATISAPTTAGGTTATASVTLQLLATSTIAAAGSGYNIGDTITLTGGTSSVTATLTVATLSGSGVATFTVSNAGVYTVLPTNPISTTSSGAGTGFTLTGSWSLTATLPVTSAGSGYVEQPTVTISGGTGSGGTAYASVGAGSVIRALGSTTTQCLDFQSPASLITGVPMMRLRDAYANSYLMISNTIDTALITAQGGSNARLFLTSFGTGNIVLGTNSTSTYTQFVVSNTTSAVNYVQVTGGATLNGVTISSQGSDNNVPMLYSTKGSGTHSFRTNTSTIQFQVTNTTNAVNRIDVTGGIAGAPPTMTCAGSDTNIDLSLTPKGTGVVQFGTYTATVTAVSGYITIKDAGGTLRKLAILT